MLLLSVTLVSMLLAAIMSVVAWRLAGDERRRSDARVEALAAEIHDGSAADFDAGRLSSRVHDDLELRPAPAAAPRAAAATPSDLFATAQPSAAASRFAAVVGIGVLVFGGAAALAVVLSAGPHGVASRQPATAALVPLELVALGQERDGDSLTVRGVVRNPASGARVDDLTAVVFLFTRDGGFVASGRATVESAPLGPGRESSFVVTVPGASDVGRFRVSFRTEDRVVPHIDKRHEG